MLETKITEVYEDEIYKNVMIDIINDGAKVGECSLMVDEDSAYCERIDIDEEHRNRGYGTKALCALSNEFGGEIVNIT